MHENIPVIRIKSGESKCSYRQFHRFPQQLCCTANIVDSFQVPPIHLGIFIYIDTDEIQRIFPFTENHIFIPRSRRYFYLSHLRILVSPWLLTWLVITRELPAQARGRFFSNFTLKMAFLRYTFAVIEFSSSSLPIWFSGTENLCIIVFISPL